jgi:hypothetical protein
MPEIQRQRMPIRMFGFVVILSLLVSGAANAESTIVIETVVNQEASEVDRYLPDVVKGLGAPPARSGTSLGADIDAHFGPAPGRLSSSALAELQARLKQSERSVFLTGTHVREAIEDMEDIRTRLADALWTLSKNADARALYQSVLLKLARAYQVNTRLSDSAKLAQARMEEVVRYFQDMPPDPNKVEKELADLFTTVQKQLPATCSLKIQAAGAAGQVCVNGFCSANSTIKLPAGEYRYFVSTPRAYGRVHKVALSSGDKKSTPIDLDFENALRTDAFVGFDFDSASIRQKSERDFAVMLGRALRADEVAVLKEASAGDKPQIIVASYGTDGTLVSIGTPGAAGVVPSEQLRRAAARLRLEERAAAGKGERPTPAQDQAAGLVVLESTAHHPGSAAPAEATVTQLPTQSQETNVQPQVAPPNEAPSAPSQSHFRLSKPLKIFLGVGFGLAAATTAAWLGSYNGFHCTGIGPGTNNFDPTQPCAAGSTGRAVEASMFGVMLAGWSVGAGALITTLVDYVLFKRGYMVGQNKGARRGAFTASAGLVNGVPSLLSVAF